ncbi:PadR family transcriptional regulator [Microbacterium binotii]|uniref:PadR family transcriptional regulator n=1 Tax=Microbacterium binotii TaxID=462710 RepID=UPI0031DFA9DC
MSRIQARQDAQLTRAVLPLLTLQLIRARESYGYELVERLAALGLDVSTGLVYPVLNRMERDGWVTTSSKPSPSGPPRKYFWLTAAGATALADARTQWEQTAAAVDLATSTSGKERA